MDYLHKVIEFVLIFIIAYLVNQHLQLIQKYERLQTVCENEKSSCHPCGGINSLIQSSTVQSAHSAPVLLSSSYEQLEMYWPGSKTKNQDHSQVTESLLSTSQSETFLKDPEETSVKTVLKSETHKHDYDEQFIGFTSDIGQVVRQQITTLQSSEEISLQTLKNFQNKTKSLLHPSSSVFSFYHKSTQRSPSLQQTENSDESFQDYNKLPVEQTHSSSHVDEKTIHEEFPSISVTSNSEEIKLERPIIHESSVMPFIITASTTKHHGESIPDRTTMTPSRQFEMAFSSASTLEEMDSEYEEQTLWESDEDYNESEMLTFAKFPNKNDNAEDDENLKIKQDYVTSTLAKSSLDILSDDYDASLFGGSSAVCGEKLGGKHCVFKNICYHTLKQDFVFFKGSDSYIKKDESQDIQNVFTLKLSTLSDHNAFMFPIIILPVESVSSFSFAVVKRKSITISRFKPDNIMHVLHDDIVPLHRTLQEFNFPKKENVFDAAIIFTDIYEDGDYFELYSTLSTIKPISLKRLNISHQLICFHEIHVGLLTSTTWYQYGFLKPQGPLTDLNPQTFVNVEAASQYIWKQFDEPCFLCKGRDFLVFLSRKDTRLIINEGDLIRAVSQSTKLKVFSLSLETHSLAAIINIVRSSQGIIGMHGSLMSMIIFLSPGSIVIELFPYGVNALHYTPFKTFASLSGSAITYRSWTNPDRQRSVPYPERPPHEGGIQHLQVQEQKEIQSQTEVPQHLCCDDPSWLYHIYQDTKVNISAVVSLTLDALEAQKSSFSNKEKFSTYIPNIPGSVENVYCSNNLDESEKDKEMKKQFTVSWESNWGLGYYSAPQDLIYEIVIQEAQAKESQLFHVPTDVLSYTFDSSRVTVTKTSAYNVWITVVSKDNGLRSQSKHVLCSPVDD